MKTKFTVQMTIVGTIILIFVLTFVTDVVKAQTYYIKKVTGGGVVTNSDFFQLNNLGINSLGVNYNTQNFTTYNPNAKLQVIDALPSSPNYGSLTSNRAVFQADVQAANSQDLRSVKLWYYDGTKFYGVHQSSSISGVSNYFQDPVLFGNLSIDGTSNNQTYISALSNSSVINFDIGPSSPMSNPTPFKIYQDSTRVIGKSAMDFFELYDNHGLGYILVSDAHGNGTWTDPSGVNFNDRKWSINNDGDLYAYPSRNHVGIGFQNSTDKILQKLHIVDGNILLSRSNGTTLSDGNGSILFGDSLVDANCPMGIWGIDYYRGGLNFWKNYCTPSKKDGGQESPGFDYGLFLKDDGTVGVGTNQTFGYKLAVHGNVICEELKVKLYANWPDYVLKNDYKLLPLKELENYIDKNHQLPGIPSAKEISENGLNVGEMNAALLKKVEELTKYIIEQQKQIDELKKKVENR